jgi:hypothetical protein
VNKLRISVVQYLNTAPLVRGFTHGPLQGKYDLSFTVPSLCAEALRKKEADIAIIRLKDPPARRVKKPRQDSACREVVVDQ